MKDKNDKIINFFSIKKLFLVSIFFFGTEHNNNYHLINYFRKSYKLLLSNYN